MLEQNMGDERETGSTDQRANRRYSDSSAETDRGIAEFDPTPYLRQLRGRGGAQTDYLDVKHRLLWLRKEHPNAEIRTEHIQIDDTTAIFKATVVIPGGGMASGHGSETAKDFPDYIEKAETKALGRALNALGYGAQFAESDDPVVAEATTQREPATPDARRSPEAPAAQRPGAPARPAQVQRPQGEQPAIEDYSWNAFWKWAREQGFSSREDLERVIGQPIEGLTPADVRQRVVRARGQ
jgi:hypothetical protein